MSGGNGGQQPGQTNSTQTQQTTSTTEPSPTIQPILKQLVGSLGGFTAGGIKAPDLFPGSMVATPSQATQSAWQTMVQRGAAGLGYGIDPFKKTLTADTLAGKYLDINSNPYFKNALAAGFAPQTENFNNNIVPNLRAQFAGSGRNLGGLDVDTVLRATKDLDQTQANASATAANKPTAPSAASSSRRKVCCRAWPTWTGRTSPASRAAAPGSINTTRRRSTRQSCATPTTRPACSTG